MQHTGIDVVPLHDVQAEQGEVWGVRGGGLYHKAFVCPELGPKRVTTFGCLGCGQQGKFLELHRPPGGLAPALLRDYAALQRAHEPGARLAGRPPADEDELCTSCAVCRRSLTDVEAAAAGHLQRVATVPGSVKVHVPLYPENRLG